MLNNRGQLKAKRGADQNGWRSSPACLWNCTSLA